MIWDGLFFGLRLAPSQLLGALLALVGIYIGMSASNGRRN
jgi:drug/metabolite transporter (DMT)-like permease